MNLNVDDLIKLVKQLSDRESAEKMVDLLKDKDVHLVDGSPTHEVVGDLLPTLRARAKNALRTGKIIYGLEESIRKIDKLDFPEVVLGYGFISSTGAGKMYISVDNTQVFGVTIVDR